MWLPGLEAHTVQFLALSSFTIGLSHAGIITPPSAETRSLGCPKSCPKSCTECRASAARKSSQSLVVHLIRYNCTIGYFQPE
ncbi:hypothetical protein GGR54DRAFT_590355 [Hypoxylon sp. NC1633]|nr:hypothetical protein GGR54DRAFT_590355 [Hypoxylon sp. NC1633]